MKIDHEAKVKIFVIMPTYASFIGSEGEPEYDVYILKRDIESWLTREKAESRLLEKQKSDPATTYVLYESIYHPQKHDHLNEYAIQDTVQW